MSLNLFIYLLFYFLIINSCIGYGYFLAKTTKINFNFFNYGYLGILGIFFLIIASYISHYFVAHSYSHNSFILVFGFICFLILLINHKKKKELIELNLFFLLLFIAFIVFKMHDDFSYYHFQYTYYLTQNELIIGIGNFNHGFRTVSSIFYLNSLFYLPIIKYYFFQMGAILIMGFSCYIFLSFIKKGLKSSNYDKIFFLSILFFIFIIIFFYRIAEHGTDRSAQILAFLLVVELLLIIKSNTSIKENIVKVLIVLSLIISLKAFYILYLLFVIPVFYHFLIEKKFDYIFLTFKNIYFYFFLIILTNILVINFFNSGCLIYPVEFTCLDQYSWSIPLKEVNLMNDWYEQWSKAGANPNFRIDNPQIYIQYFNWVSNWFDEYFFTKVSDFLLGLLFLTLVVILIYRPKKNFYSIFDFYKGEKLIYFILILLFAEWFYNHPTLRYGGYQLVCLIIFLPISNYLTNKYPSQKITLKTYILLTIAATIFIGRNLDRLYDENKQYQFNPLLNPTYRINESYFSIQDKLNCNPGTKKCDTENSIIVKKKHGYKIFYKIK